MSGSLQSQYKEYWKNWRAREKVRFVLTRGQEDPPTERLKERLSGAVKIKDEGNGYFKQGEYVEAIRKYHEAIGYLPEVESTVFINEDYLKFKLTIMTNVAMCFMKLNNYEMVVKQCKIAIIEHPNNLKLNYYLGMALSEMGQEKEALSILRKVKVSQPNNKEVAKKIEELEITIEKYKESMKSMFGNKPSPQKKEEVIEVQPEGKSYRLLYLMGTTLAVGAIGYFAYRRFKSK